ncbi:uncharacterized protein LOC112058599 [Bicyclus anynana]|uniref:Uncharacterized protein LOC112058599 n=1 Tax=Bicyclus anynana TaxID=110368 RepID=A0ABM3M6T9_BICAN|nr:uncharacterized protein LOC112058599 [Bicyclus anynana]
MFCTGQKKLALLARNEGKLKEYGSCLDLRAWSHDLKVQDCYLRDWMKSDMPIYVIPVHTVASCLRIMTKKRSGWYTPSCHPKCKSKVVLESICDSCHAMKDCLKNDDNFEKYFIEEEFDTTHWPCEKCLDALKSLKMFWKIITEKIFKLYIPTNVNMKSASSSNKSVESVTQAWQDELMQQTLLVKKLKTTNIEELNKKPTYLWQSYTKYLKKIIMQNNSDEIESCIDNKKLNKITDICEEKAIQTHPLDFSSLENKRSPLLVKKISKCTSFSAKTVDYGCDACHIDYTTVNMYKNNLDYLQQQYNVQSDELSHLKIENKSLKLQLQDMTKKSLPLAFTIPKPYEHCCEKDETVKNVDSEMVITLKNCKNEDFKHVSMLEVLHKTNGSRLLDENLIGLNNYWKKKQDPIKILTKVHNTFGALVKRELSIANHNKCDTKEVEIDASYNKVDASKSVASCTPQSSHSLLDVFTSTTEV